MADLTISQRFGSNASFDQTAGTLTIKLSDLADQADGGDMTNGLGLDTTGMSSANKDSYSSRILWALVGLNAQNQPETNNDETVGVYVTNEGRRNVTRNSFAQLGFRLTTTAYIADTQGVTLDPDDI
jgi:hypothetical protein